MENQRRKKALIVYDTRYENTEKIAKALASGMEAYCEVECVNVVNASPMAAQGYDFIALGAATEGLSASRGMKEFLSKLGEAAVFSGKLGFAFETRTDTRHSGSAAKFIEAEMVKLGFKLVLPRRTAFVRSSGDRVLLKDGEEERFESTGDELGLFVSRY
jgi:flavodoxin